MALQILTRPLERWPRDFTQVRKRKPFRTKRPGIWAKLRYELKHLKTTTVILQLAIEEKNISPVTGLPRDDRMPKHPGVIIAADTNHGALKWICDDCQKWEDNIYAIALTLERLRLADIYGVTGRGEQYAGWKMLPGPITAGGEASHGMTIDAAARFVAPFGGVSPHDILSKKSTWEKTLRAGAKKLHPGTPTGDAEKWKVFEMAAQLLNDLHARR